MKGSDRGYPYLALFLKLFLKYGDKPAGFLAARALANVFAQPTNQFAVLQYRTQVLDGLKQVFAKFDAGLHKNAKIASASMLLNFAMSVRERGDSAVDVAC